jgi:hypothetical protein
MTKAAVHAKARLMSKHANASVGHAEQRCAEQHRRLRQVDHT